MIKTFEIRPTTAIANGPSFVRAYPKVQAVTEEQALARARKRWPLAAGWLAIELDR
jgi:hypothetical protein